MFHKHPITNSDVRGAWSASGTACGHSKCITMYSRVWMIAFAPVSRPRTVRLAINDGEEASYTTYDW